MNRHKVAATWRKRWQKFGQHRCMGDSNSASLQGVCLYSDGKDGRCAIGALLTKRLATSCIGQVISVKGLYGKKKSIATYLEKTYGVVEADLSALTSLQQLHDAQPEGSWNALLTAWENEE